MMPVPMNPILDMIVILVLVVVMGGLMGWDLPNGPLTPALALGERALNAHDSNQTTLSCFIQPNPASVVVNGLYSHPTQP